MTDEAPDLTSDLKPCPFCSATATVVGYETRYTVSCNSLDCKGRGPTQATAQKAKDAWNARATEDAVRRYAEAYWKAADLTVESYAYERDRIARHADRLCEALRRVNPDHEVVREHERMFGRPVQ